MTAPALMFGWFLGAQNQQPRTGTEFDAQKQFPANVDDVITPLHQSSSIKTLYRTPVPWWTLDLARCIYGTQWHAAVHDLTPYWRLQWDCDRSSEIVITCSCARLKITLQVTTVRLWPLQKTCSCAWSYTILKVATVRLWPQEKTHS